VTMSLRLAVLLNPTSTGSLGENGPRPLPSFFPQGGCGYSLCRWFRKVNDLRHAERPLGRLEKSADLPCFAGSPLAAG
jgi:hypothetical protein